VYLAQGQAVCIYNFTGISSRLDSIKMGLGRKLVVRMEG